MQTHTKYRLLVVRLGAMGDILHALPAVSALRAAHPGWIIDWVVEPQWLPLLSALPDVSAPPDLPNPTRISRDLQPLIDRVHLAPSKAWRRNPLSTKTIREIHTLHQTLRACDYDTVIDLQGAIRSAVVARFAGCPRVIGEATPRERAARWLYNEKIGTRGAHVIEQDVELAAAIAGDNLAPVQPLLPVDPAAESWADQLLPTASKSVLINPGAGWGAKRWPLERYADVAKHYLQRGYHVLVNAGPGEKPLLQSLSEQTGGAITPVTGNLAQLIAVTRRITLAIAGDTGPLHLACALGRPVVGIYGPTDPSRNGPFGTRFRVLRSPQSRRDHTRHATPEAGLLTILPDQVLRAADELLAEGQGQ